MSEIGNLPHLAFCLEEQAALVAARGEFERAAKLYGAAEALRESVHAPVPVHERARHASEVESVRAALEEASFVKACHEGRSMSLESSVVFALGPTS